MREPQITIRLSTLLTLAAGVALGLLLNGGIASAKPADGQWECYVNDRFPEAAEAADWRGARKMTGGLNNVAPHAPSGTVITAGYPTSNTDRDISITCVKG